MMDFELEGQNLIFSDTTVHKAANVMQTQEGYLYYAEEFGLDLERFFNPDVTIQTETFKAYSIQRLTDCGVNVLELNEKTGMLDTYLDYYVKFNDSTGLIAQ